MTDQPTLYRYVEKDWTGTGNSSVRPTPVEIVGFIDINAETDWWEDVDRCFYVPGLPEGRYAVVRLEDDYE